VVKYGATTIDVDSATGSSYAINIPCTCTSWQDKDCGEDDCSSDQRFQIRNCTPSGCTLESRCIDDSSCVSQPLIEGEEEEEGEEPEEKIEEPAERKVILVPEENKIPKGLLASLAMTMGEISRSALFAIVTILCLMGLVAIGVREWWLFRKKRKK